MAAAREKAEAAHGGLRWIEFEQEREVRKLSRSGLIAIALVACTSLAVASGWGHYGNARFQYGIDIPPGFSSVAESDNGDGGVSRSADGRAELKVWGSYLADRDFAAEVRWRIAQDRDGGWTVSYRKEQARWAVWSGTKGNRIVYERAIAGCKDAAAYVRIEYDKDQTKAFDPIIARLGKSLRGGGC